MQTLILQLLEAKRLEEAAKERRLEIEQALLAQINDQLRPEGQTKIKLPGYTITVTCSFNRRIDQSVLDAVREVIPSHLMDEAFRWKPEVNLTGLRRIYAEYPAVHFALSQAITTTPAKPSIKIEQDT